MKKKSKGKYRPSNGTEGEHFQYHHCMHCIHDTEKSPCEILMRSMAFGVDDPEYPEEWTYSDDGSPTCTAMKVPTVSGDTPKKKINPLPGQMSFDFGGG